MPCLAMKSSARSLPPWIGCQHSTGSRNGRGTSGQLFEIVAAIGHPRRDRVVLALVREALVVERLEDDVDLLLEQLAVGRLVEQRRAEGLDLAGVIAAPDAKGDAAAGQDVGRRIILGQPQRVPHRRDVEAAADLDALRHMRQVQRRHQHVRDALVAFVLEMVLGHPEGVVAEPVHQLRHRLGLVEDGRRDARSGSGGRSPGRRHSRHSPCRHGRQTGCRIW